MKKIIFSIILLFYFLNYGYAIEDPLLEQKEKLPERYKMYATEQKEKKFTGAFGYKLGDVLINFELIEPNDYIDFSLRITPKTPCQFRSFYKHKIMVTPKTHKIYLIYAYAPLDSEDCAKEQLILKELFIRRYGFQEQGDLARKVSLKKENIDLTIEIIEKEAVSADSGIELLIEDTTLRQQAEEEMIETELKNIDPNCFQNY